MKVSIGHNFIVGPWGGGNSFAIQLKQYLENHNVHVTNTLEDADIDIILLTEPRSSTRSSAFSHHEVKKYIKKYKNTIVVNRINECDERKNTKGLNKFLINVSKVSDYTVFISNWLQDLYIQQGFTKKSYSVIRNGGNPEIFSYSKSLPNNKITKIITHHWGSDVMKGANIYKKLDELMGTSLYKDKFEFIYVGNVPKKSNFKNTTIIEPKYGSELAAILKSCDLYITGSLNEPAGMHHIESSLCGLPILYIESGGIPEYCSEFGLAYNYNNLEEKVKEILIKREELHRNLKYYPYTGEKMCKQYLDLFQDLLTNKTTILKSRKVAKYQYLKREYRLFNKNFYI